MEQMKHLFKMVEDETDNLGDIRVIRILRKQTPGIFGIDASAPDLKIEDAVMVAIQIASNCQDELDAIDDKRVLWMTGFSAVAAGAAAILAAVSVLIGIGSWLWK